MAPSTVALANSPTLEQKKLQKVLGTPNNKFTQKQNECFEFERILHKTLTFSCFALSLRRGLGENTDNPEYEHICRMLMGENHSIFPHFLTLPSFGFKTN